MHSLHGLTIGATGCALLLLGLVGSQTIPPPPPTETFPEVLLKNGSSYVILTENLRLTQGSLVGFSFRTCLPSGELLRRQTGGSSDLLVMSLTEAGSLLLSLEVGEVRRSLVSGSGLADGAWHTVRLGVSPDRTTLCLSVDGSGSDTECTQPRTGPALVNQTSETSVSRLPDMETLLAALDLSAQLRVGFGLVGCVREGPGLRFFGPGRVTDSAGAVWTSCLLPASCTGYNWPQLTDTSLGGNPCVEATCDHGGLCLPLLTPPAGAPATTCVCRPGLTGPTCSAATTSCAQTPCLHRGTCTEEPVSGGFICSCSGTGYSGTHCETELNHCTGTVCENGGECLDQPGGFLCACAEGWTGATCSARISRQDISARSLTEDCQSVPPPCLNGGTCASNGPTVSCTCAPGFTGVRCELAADPCENLICPENAQCMQSQGGEAGCFCNPGYTGDPGGSCFRIDFCLGSPCGNGSTCTSTSTGFICACSAGWQGPRCDEVADPCLTDPCMNGGTCTSEGGTDGFLCSCAPGYTGQDCGEDVNECLNNPCLNGVCSNQVGGYQCRCESGWSGQNCDINIDECLSNPCVNATCQDKVNDYSCLCSPGFTGKNCEENIDECLLAPCLNGGTCIDGVNNFTCSCSSRFMGLRCESAYDACAAGPCQNGASCVKKSSERGAPVEFECTCVLGYEGPRCEHNIDDCLGVVCPEVESCVDLVNAYECRCPTGFTGPGCAQDIDECLPSPCLNGAVCSNLVGNYTCACAPGFTGRNCAQDVDECRENSNICNNGICQNSEGSYQCYCRPGYSGSHCTYDFNECLSDPCLNGGSCENLVNAYSCTCSPGFNGTNCEVDINECFDNPCMNGATCVDGINSFTCACQPGYTGSICDVNIDDCAPMPCLNNGECSDGVNMYTCNCTNTGFTGNNCEVDIDECAVSPCVNNATCLNLVNDYKCECWGGFEGKNCETDIKECELGPCQNNGTCYERSNLVLYEMYESLPSSVREDFVEFSYQNASGYICDCPPGFTGLNCEIDIDDCVSSPCKNGAECVDQVNDYSCNCVPGYEGKRCHININECNKYDPCQNDAKCEDLVADYRCICREGFGGKNCSVPLTGCRTVRCMHGGTCIPWLQGEDDHRGNCSCVPGYDGDLCQITTTFSFKGESYISQVNSDGAEGFELSLRFRTTIPNGLVAFGHIPSWFLLNLSNGKLNLQSSMLSIYEGILIGEGLADTNWQKVFVTFNISHLTIGLNDRLQAIHPINPDSPNQTAFAENFLGGVPSDLKALVKGTPDFVGCMQDISVNGIKVTEDDVRKPFNRSRGITERNTEKNCQRKDECQPNPCKNGGNCTDLWTNYKCLCHRPFLGPSCQYEYTAATFGYENTTNSQVRVKIKEPNDYKDGIDITMFIRTRQSNGIIFYLGVDPTSVDKNQIIGRLVNGTLQVEARFGDKPAEYFKLYSAQLDNGNRHFIRVTRMKNQMTVKVNETISIKQEISSVIPIKADYLYLGNLIETEVATTLAPELTTLPPPLPLLNTVQVVNFVTTDTTLPTTTNNAPPAVADTTLPTTELLLVTSTDGEDLTTTVLPVPVISRAVREVLLVPRSESATFFKGIIQDVQLSNGSTEYNKIVKLFELDFAENVSVGDSLGEVSTQEIIKGVLSDNSCRTNPCQNNGVCLVTWNAYECQCQPGYMGENCGQIEYCYWNQCPEGSACRTLTDGHECITNATFNGADNAIVYRAQLRSEVDITSVVAQFRTKTDGTLLFVIGSDNSLLKIAIQNGQIDATLPVAGQSTNLTFGTGLDDGHWHTVSINNVGGSIVGSVNNTMLNEYFLEENEPQLNLTGFMNDARIVLGSEYILNRFDDYFRGCVGEVRIGNILLPYFSEAQLVNSTASNKFMISDSVNVKTGACVLCYENECQNQGFCSAPSDRFECQCRAGFNGSTCAINIDECAASACQHGDCVDGINSYSCTCAVGWTGQYCEIDQDECQDNPCRNGGTCNQTDLPGSYVCTCTDEFRGVNCEENKIRTCKEEPCTNGGVCIPQPDSLESDRYRCDCLQGYEGFNCERKTDFCVKHNAVCQNGGTCVSDYSTFNYKCLCVDGYTGVNCQTNINDCLAGQCKNGALCIDEVNSYRCDCSGTGYQGPSCQENIDECAVQRPCRNEARCNDTLGSYSCICQGSFCGKNCQRTDPCRDFLGGDLCNNGGVCVSDCDREPYYACSCSAGWEGPNCILKSSSSEELAMIVGPIIGGMAFIALIGLLVFLVMARRKRKGEGHYRPAKQELTSPRLQLDTVLKVPPEERLI